MAILSLDDIGCHDDIPETADTFEGNALLKARWVKERYGYDCFADDSGSRSTLSAANRECAPRAMPEKATTLPPTMPSC